MKKNYRSDLNILPLFGDLSLLTFGVFILVLIGALYNLARLEAPTNVDPKTYFLTSNYVLAPSEIKDLEIFIVDSVFNQIETLLEKNSLAAVRIEGHSDASQPNNKKTNLVDKAAKIIGRSKAPRWENNMELSFFRAQEVANVLNRVTADMLSPSQNEELKKLISISGYGENKPQYIRKRIESLFYVVNVDSINSNSYDEYIDRLVSDTSSGPFSESDAKVEAYSRNRRVVINIIKKGI